MQVVYCHQIIIHHFSKAVTTISSCQVSAISRVENELLGRFYYNSISLLFSLKLARNHVRLLVTALKPVYKQCNDYKRIIIILVSNLPLCTLLRWFLRRGDPDLTSICCGSILSLVRILFSLMIQTHYHILPDPKTKENNMYVFPVYTCIHLNGNVYVY